MFKVLHGSVFNKLAKHTCRSYFAAPYERLESLNDHCKAAESSLQNFVDGRRCLPVDYKENELIGNINPATGKAIGQFYSSGDKEVKRAIESAKEAFVHWSQTPNIERGSILRRISKVFRKHLHEIAKLETVDTGKTIAEATFDIEAVIDCTKYFSAQCFNLNGEQIPLHNGAFAYTRKEPLGVCAGIGAWNFPIQNIAWKALPALVCGNTLVYKPSPLTPLTSTLFAEILTDVGLPPGCLNVVQGGGEVGQLFCSSQDVAKVSFTGSAESGSKVMAACAAGIKPVTLELGGKSPLIIFEDADMENAVQGALMANFITQGEVCSNGARVYVHESIYDRFLANVVEATKKLRVGDTMDGRSQIGALISQDHLDKVTGFVDRAVGEGARILCGGSKPDFSNTHNSDGYYFTPCVMDSCNDDMEIIRKEHFGPIMCVLKFSNEEEVIKRANNTQTGLAGGVFTRDISRAHRVIANLQAGSCCINTYNMYPVQLPFGGFKMSGIGRENGEAVLAHYTQLKSVYVEMNDVESMFL